MTATSDRIIANLSDNLGELQRENTRLTKALEAAQTALAANTRLNQERDSARAKYDMVVASAAENTRRRLDAEDANTPLVEELTQMRSALTAFYGLSVACDKCGAPAWKPCMTDTGRFTVHSPRVTKAVAAIPADDSLTPEGGPEGAADNSAIRTLGLGECVGHLGPPGNTATPHPKGETCSFWRPLPSDNAPIRKLAPDECPACHVRGLSMERLNGACHALECPDPTAWLRAREPGPNEPRSCKCGEVTFPDCTFKFWRSRVTGYHSADECRPIMKRAPVPGLYPAGWPKCACGDYCMDGKATCGRVECLR